MVRRLAADERDQHRGGLAAVLREHLLDALEQLLQVVRHLGCAWLDRCRISESPCRDHALDIGDCRVHIRSQPIPSVRIITPDHASTVGRIRLVPRAGNSLCGISKLLAEYSNFVWVGDGKVGATRVRPECVARYCHLVIMQAAGHAGHAPGPDGAAHAVPTICPQLHIFAVIWRDAFWQVTAILPP